MYPFHGTTSSPISSPLKFLHFHGYIFGLNLQILHVYFRTVTSFVLHKEGVLHRQKHHSEKLDTNSRKRGWREELSQLSRQFSSTKQKTSKQHFSSWKKLISQVRSIRLLLPLEKTLSTFSIILNQCNDTQHLPRCYL